MSGPEVVASLAGRLGASVEMRWTRNRSVYLSLRPARDRWVLRLHGAFREAPPEVWRAVEAFLRTGERRHLGAAREFFVRNRGAVDGRRSRSTVTGAAHDLEGVLERTLRRGPFEGLPPVEIGWARRVSPGRKQVRLGSYRAGPPARIRVHPVFDAAEVPECVVARVIHHELAHHCLTHRAGVTAGRSHGRRFRDLERRFPEEAEARAWEGRHLRRLLRRAREAWAGR